MWDHNIEPGTKDEILNYLKSPTLHFDEQVADVYDCEDNAFWGVAHTRGKFTGAPMAVAIGYQDGEKHAVIVFWVKDKNNYNPQYFDPRIKDSIGTFDAKMVVPFPAYRPHSGGSRNDLQPYDKFSWAEDRALVLDNSYDLIDPDLFEDIVEYLKKRAYGEYPGLGDPYQSIEDRVLWDFVHLRREYKGAAIGMAFGTLKTSKGPYDHAMIVLWDDKEEPRPVDIGAGRKPAGEPKSKWSKFAVKTLIV